MRVLTQPTTWAPHRHYDDLAHLRETCDGLPRLITFFDSPVPVARGSETETRRPALPPVGVRNARRFTERSEG